MILRGASRETLTLGTEMSKAASKLKTLDADFQKALLKAIERAAHGLLHGRPRRAERGLGHARGGPQREASPAAARGRRTTRQGSRPPAGARVATCRKTPRSCSCSGRRRRSCPEEIEALGRYAKRGGKLLIALDPDAKADLGPLAAVVDLTFDPTILATTDQFSFAHAAQRRGQGDPRRRTASRRTPRSRR